MLLSYKKLTEEQDKLRNVFEKGEYPFRVINVMQKQTKKKLNNMLVVELNIMNDVGKSMMLTDYIMLDMDNMEWKLRHFCAACDILENYENETLEISNFIGKRGLVKLSISDYEKNGELVKCNRVNDYVKTGDLLVNSVKISNIDPIFNDDLPSI